MSRITRVSLIPAQGYAHREHRSRKGRSKAHRMPYRKTRRFLIDKSIEQDHEFELKNIPVAGLLPAPSDSGRRSMDEKYIKRLCELGRELCKASKDLTAVGDLSQEEIRLLSISMHTAGFIEALNLPIIT